VDEFLEQVADAVERLHEEAKSAAERAEAAERGARDRTGLEDEESIRRTLVLAQRTADMAIREAREEAATLLDGARTEAETLVGDARDSAVRITSEAEQRLREEVTRLTSARDDMRSEVDTLVNLLGTERERLTETLGSALRYVERSLVPSPDLLSLSAAEDHGEADAGASEGGPGLQAEVDTPTASEPDEVNAGGHSADGSEADAVAMPTTGEVAIAHADANEAVSDSSPAEADDLEANIAEDAAAAAPTYARELESDHYDWDSVIGSRPDPLFSDRERPNLTALPPLDEPSHDAVNVRAHGGDWPA
jgi:vacuolar-type H+-ATPase subunit H